MSTKTDAISALADSLKGRLPEDRVAAMPTPTHTATLEDNLLPTLTHEQVELVRAQLRRGDGRELQPRSTGEPPDAHAAHSSSAAAANLFGVWLGRPDGLTIAGLTGFDAPLELEVKVPFQAGGRAPNLDALVAGTGIAVGVESKLTEMLSGHQPRVWQESISRPHNLSLLDGGWRTTLDSAIDGTYTARYLEPGQLLRHALGIQRRYGGRDTHLIYCYWEPTNADEHEVIRAHRAEIAEFAERVADSSPQFHAITHAQLVSEWDVPGAPVGVPEHCAAWRARYQLAI